MNTIRSKLIFGTIMMVVIVYIASFAVLAYFGGYMGVASGEWRPFMLASGDTWVWQPRYGMFYPFREAGGHRTHQADAIGYIYSPLICATQHSLRPSMRFILPDGTAAVPYPVPARSELHPMMEPVISKFENELHISYDDPRTWKKLNEPFRNP